MSRIHIATRDASDWRSRLGNPEKHWKRRASAMETAVNWESAAGLPPPIAALFRESALGEPNLLLAVAEHKVGLAGRGGAAQCDVWALVRTVHGIISLAVEAKAQEAFGDGNESLALWRTGGSSTDSEANRAKRWQHVQENLPERPLGTYDQVPFQILQRCAAAMIEARRFDLKHAVFLVQSFGSPDASFRMYERFAAALGLPAEKHRLCFTAVGDVQLGIGWVDCPFATDAQVLSGLGGDATFAADKDTT